MAEALTKSRWSLRGRGKVILIAIAVAAGSYLYLYDPAAYPAWQCPIFALTGLQCTGCGGQRAVHALLHGRVHEALALNGWLVAVVLPLGTLFGARTLATWACGWQVWKPGPVAWIALALSGFAFLVWRNLP